MKKQMQFYTSSGSMFTTDVDEETARHFLDTLQQSWSQRRHRSIALTATTGPDVYVNPALIAMVFVKDLG